MWNTLVVGWRLYSARFYRVRKVMSKEGRRNYRFDRAGVYEIQVVGWLRGGWAERYGGLTVARIEESPDSADTVVILTGWLVDQAALNGVLNALYDDQCSILGLRYLGREEELS